MLLVDGKETLFVNSKSLGNSSITTTAPGCGDIAGSFKLKGKFHLSILRYIQMNLVLRTYFVLMS